MTGGPLTMKQTLNNAGQTNAPIEHETSKFIPDDNGKAGGCVDILFSSRDKSWTLYYGEQGPACSLVFCPPHPISPTQDTAPWDFRGTNNFILGIILQWATGDNNGHVLDKKVKKY